MLAYLSGIPAKKIAMLVYLSGNGRHRGKTRKKHDPDLEIVPVL
jgi:hypothetical protein